MDSREYLASAVRDGLIIDSLHRAPFSMRLTSGSTIVVNGAHMTLHFESEMVRLERALRVLGIAAGETLCVSDFHRRSGAAVKIG